MGFWKSAGSAAMKIGKFAFEVLDSTAQETRKNKSDFKDFDDGRLKRKLADGTTSERMAAASLLKEKGGKK